MSARIEASQADTALYIENMCAELRNMAATADLNMLAYLLDIAREEAAAQTISIRPMPKASNTAS
ncbi:hypothetical protein GGD81_000517 [Rhodobium orientis]|uniref:Uncharacterized protein n=1 Tax=Rhodobium orientis TaxID=34017 RepID=A0A327JJM5_9HYPH|nr:hypothetical protein [Rhodobium orientis]MBB4301500.1 hypothetical protein [Rhodobium orientis]MBK5952197.1 hypothetical protein [Rhodobium orientis]RAI25463.1 hypothetical protein CH339_18220 [Rhodobium orientis]